MSLQKTQDDVDNVEVIKLSRLLRIEKVIIFFPYNQHKLLIPNKQFWDTYTNHKALLFVSPNTIIESAPRSNLVIVTKNEMTLNYLQEIKSYIPDTVKQIQIIASDIHLPRIKRDLQLVFADKFAIEYTEIKLPNSFWKIIYSVREWTIRHLPVFIYKILAKKQEKFRS